MRYQRIGSHFTDYHNLNYIRLVSKYHLKLMINKNATIDKLINFKHLP